ncbi:hypothetical protein OAA24_00880 [bacterium]|jgi:hypothetical protein|nr:hypothetical protein [bacterium]
MNKGSKSEEHLAVIAEWMKSEDRVQIKFHSSKKLAAIKWVEYHLEDYRWKFKKWTDLHEHSMYFKTARDAALFTTRCLDSKEDRL